MNLKRIFANAVARRVAYVLVAAALAWMGIGSARAAHNDGSQGAAFAHCKEQQAQSIAGRDPSTPGAVPADGGCPLNAGPTTSQYACFFDTRSGTSGPLNLRANCVGDNVHQFPTTGSCSAQPSQTTTFLPLGGSLSCNLGCQYIYSLNADDTTSTRSPTGQTCDAADKSCPPRNGRNYFWNGYMAVCQPVEPECTSGQTLVKGVCQRNEECPAGMIGVAPGTPGGIASGALYCKPSESECPAGNIKAPSGECLPGEGQCAAGEVKRKDGTCGKDADNDGEADDDDDDPNNDSEKETFSGGDSCTAPPSCSGSPVMCGQARIQWRIDCNTRKNRNVSGGSCAAMPVCTGEKCDAVEHTSMIMQWRTACAVEKLTGQGTGSPGGGETTADYMAARDAANKAQADALAGGGDGHEGVDVADMWQTNGTGTFNPNMFGGGSSGQCSFSVPLEIAGKPITIDPAFWTLMSIIGWIVTASAYIWVAYLLM